MKSEFGKPLNRIMIDKIHLYWTWIHFRSAYRFLPRMKDLLDREVPITVMTATSPHYITTTVLNAFRIPPQSVLQYPCLNPRIALSIVRGKNSDNYGQLVWDCLKTYDISPRTLIFIDKIVDGIHLIISLQSISQFVMNHRIAPFKRGGASSL
jgi:superfamily II DNA helicase RecQ